MPEAVSIQTVFDPSALLTAPIEGPRDRRRANLRLLGYTLLGSASYGLAMGLRHSLLQGLVSALKVPTLFLLTLAICLPSLFVLGLKNGWRQPLDTLARVVLRGIAVSSMLLSGFAPIALFFALSGSPYAFMLGLHVAVFGFCGLAGLASIVRGFMRLRGAPGGIPQGSPLWSVLGLWLWLYVFVGTQLGYMLSPFIGKDEAFLFLTTTEYNFYTYLWEIFAH